MHPEIDDQKSVDDEEIQRMEHALVCVRNVGNTLSSREDLAALDLVMTYAQNAIGFREQTSQARDRERDVQFELDAVKEELEEEKSRSAHEISKLEETIKDYRTREASHAGMCAAYEKAMIAVAQGFATGR